MKSVDNKQTFYDARDLKEVLGVCEGRARELMRGADGFPAVKISSRRYIVSADALERWYNAQVYARQADAG